MAATVRIWDPFVRVFHWCLVASFAVAWLTAEDWKALHMWAGYAAGSLIALRLLWGVVGPAMPGSASSFARRSPSPPMFGTSSPAGRPGILATTRPAA